MYNHYYVIVFVLVHLLRQQGLQVIKQHTYEATHV